MVEFILKGLIIGFVIAAPVGPIGILCIQRTLKNGFKIGLMSGIGAAIADGFFGAIAGFGFTAVLTKLMDYRFWIELLGGLCLVGIGLKLIGSEPKESTPNDLEKQSWHALTTSFLLTLSNPMTILAFIAVFATMRLKSMTYTHALVLVLSITAGSACWWLLLTGTVAFVLHHRISSSGLQWINRLSGCVMLGFGLVVLFALFIAR